MKHLKPFKTYGSILLGATAFLFPVISTIGQASAAPSSTANSVIKVSPVRTEITVKPGETTKVSAFVTNTTKASEVYRVVENDFVAGDEKGSPSLILDANSYAPTHSLKRFMKPVPNVTVAAGATQQVDVTIAVPKTAQAGGYFGALRFVPGDGTASMVNLSPSATSLILLTVPGALVENANLTNFDVQQDGNTASNFRDAKNLSVLVRFQNTGNVQVAPYGQINVKKGDKVVYSKAFNSDTPKDNVLPDSARRWSVPISNFSKFGKYTIQGDFSYGTANKSIEIKKTFWIVPTMYLLIGGGILLVLILIIVLIIALIKAKRGGGKRSSRRYY